MIRRDFIRLAALTTGSLPFLDLTAHAQPPGATSPLFELFRDPANAYRPMVRWWWNGDRVVAKEVVRELDVMQAAGIGGVEINPIRFPNEADPMDTQALTWMSDEWIEVLKAALQGTRERGMTCDMIVGSGWPYGGEFLTREDQTQMMALGTRNLTGPAHVRITRSELLEEISPKLVSSYKDSEKKLAGLTVVSSQLTSVAQATPIAMTPDQEVMEFDLPAGGHVLYYLVHITGFMAVINGAPGATGPVLNHYNGAAVERYLNRLSTRLSAKIGPLRDHFRAIFTDSIELEGANWCDDMFVEFRKRRGYDLAPWLPFVLFKVGEMGNAVSEHYGASFSPELHAQTELVRYDFETTKHELFQERFVATFAAWCTHNGVKSRMQAYGMDCDPITAGMMLDIPECETWIRTEQIQEFGIRDDGRGRSYTMINKYVSSAAHLAGKQLISCEEMTNTDDPFHASLERIKVAGDQSMLSGVTQSVLHGFNYSPLAAPFPGWARYGTFFNERNTWWPFFKLWADYKARLSAVFQHSVMQAQVAILPPMADLASQYGFQRDPFPKTALPAYINRLWEVIHQNGNGCDYLNEDILARAHMQGGKIVFGDRAYGAIVLAEVDSIHPATAMQLKTFVASGGTVLFLERTPSRAAGLVHHASDSETIRNIFENISNMYPQRAPVVSVVHDDMVGWYRGVQRRYGLKPDVAIDEPTDYINQVHYASGDQDLYFFSHDGPQPEHTFEATFSCKGRQPWLWNPETGERSPYPASGTGNTLSITLGPSESKLIVFEPARASSLKTAPQSATKRRSTDSEITTPWEVSFLHVDGTKQTKTLSALGDLAQEDAFKAFAGTIVYRNEFPVDKAGEQIVVRLGHVHSVTQVAVNGQAIGTRWYGEQS